jgi:hypothetical protein
VQLWLWRIVPFAALACLLPLGNSGCTTTRVIRKDAPPGRVVENCQRTIRSYAIDELGGPADVRFDTPETFFISSGTEGVRGAALHRGARRDRRIYYSCVVDVYSGRVQDARYRVVGEAERTDDWPVEACQQVVRDQVYADKGRGANVKFAKAQSYHVSRNEEGVRGDGRWKVGKDWVGLEYECTVDLRRGQVTRARYRPLEKPLLSDKGAVKLCQQTIEDQAKSDRGQRTKAAFKSGDAFGVSRFERGVRGRAELKYGAVREQVDYECSVDVRAVRVSAAHYRTLASLPSEDQIVKNCQAATREMVTAQEGRRTSVQFETAEMQTTSRQRGRVQGRGTLKAGGSRDPMAYFCTADLRTAKITAARYRRLALPPDRANRTVELCHEELRARVASDRDDVASLTFATSETSFVSNSKETVRGRGELRFGNRGRVSIRYECTVDIRRGRVTDARYSYR